jgi:hypothetical protein
VRPPSSPSDTQIPVNLANRSISEGPPCAVAWPPADRFLNTFLRVFLRTLQLAAAALAPSPTV